MTADNIALAKECGASVGERYVKAPGVGPHQFVDMSESALTLFVQRIEERERERCAAKLDALHEAQAGSSVWHNYFLHGADVIRENKDV